jgi:hypothetical protein
MTTVALPGGGNMGRMLTSGDSAVVATGTGAGNTGMIEATCGPGYCGMTVFARLIGRDVICRLTRSIHIVMTTCTAGNDTGVIKADVEPGGIGDMAVVTGGVGLHMTGRLAGCCIAIVTAGAATGHNGVIETDPQPVVG